MNEITTTEGIAQSILPYYMDGGKKADYLKYLISGFSVMEAVKLAGIHFRTVMRWRESDSKFKELEDTTPELRKQLADTIVDIDFTRNFRLVLAKDFKVLFKDATGDKLSESEEKYLHLIRKFYTPQQFAMIKQIVGGNGSGEAFDYTKTVLSIRLEKEEGFKVELPKVREADEGWSQ